MVALARVELLAFLLLQHPPSMQAERGKLLLEMQKELGSEGKAAPGCAQVLLLAMKNPFSYLADFFNGSQSLS